MPPFFTIATITYNSASWVRYAIESVLASTYENFEYLISDDASTDETWEIIESYKNQKIKAWRNESNIGEYPNRNKVLEGAIGKYIFYIDGDDILYKNTLQNLHSFLSAFPDTGMVWGMCIDNLDFVVLPYQFSPQQITQLIYFSHLPLSMIGLGETVFNTHQLKEAGGFGTSYRIGDTYIKRKLALSSRVLLVPGGLSFWRRSEYQASKKAVQNYRSFIDMHYINKEVLQTSSPALDEGSRQAALQNVRISECKLLIKLTLFKGRIKDFIKLKQELKMKPADLKFLFKKGRYDYNPAEKISSPLMNNYNFTSHAKEQV